MPQRRKQRSYTGKFRQMVIETMHRDKLSYRETARKFDIGCKETVIHWERIYYKEGPEALCKERRGLASYETGMVRRPEPSKKPDEDIIAELQRLRAENAYLKKLHALVSKRVRQEKNRK